ncbi:hypothetical protein [Aestuariirhabdus haliotis]|uniref:hypothetical protein n=1 Tax=Aestuariirhabdus haliotis TaxID=2918751 RepID=UPI0020BD626C|nr:hypothetical protein [Aestuariirhabdus haliotis]MCL6420133.1 hypothetical protein [Aestuariirhabdus haliotis]
MSDNQPGDDRTSKKDDSRLKPSEQEPERVQASGVAALRYHAIPLLLLVVLTVPGLILATFDPENCTKLLGWPLSLLGLLYFTLWLPGSFWLLSLWLGSYGLRIVRTGIAPPPGMPVLFNTRVRRGTAARIKGFIWLGTPLYCTWLLMVGLNAYEDISQGRSLSEMSALIEAECKTP